MDPKLLLDPRGTHKAKGTATIPSLGPLPSSTSSASSHTLSLSQSSMSISQKDHNISLFNAHKSTHGPDRLSSSSQSPNPSSSRSSFMETVATSIHPTNIDEAGSIFDQSQRNSLPGNSRPQHSISSDAEGMLTSEGDAQSKNAGNRVVPKVNTPSYDARSLLDPRAASKRTVSGNEKLHNGDTESTPGLGMSSFIEKMHGVHDRTDQLQKRVKRDHDSEAGKKKKSQSNGMSGGALEMNKPNGSEAAPPKSTNVVDLTTGDDDDDVILVRDTGDQEVCIGRIKDALIAVHTVPFQAPGKYQGTPAIQPRLKVRLRRLGTQNLRIPVFDPTGHEFGSLDLRTAQAVAPLMDTSRANGLRWSAVLETRKKAREEGPAGTLHSFMTKVVLQLYCPRKNAIDIGRYLNRRTITLEEPIFERERFEYFNPQSDTSAPPADPRALLELQNVDGGAPGFVPSGNYIMRSVEEIRMDVQQMFDEIAETEQLPERDQDPSITTPLLSHQRKALKFMLDREQDCRERDPLWQEKFRNNGVKYYYNVITGHESPVRPPSALGGILADEMGLGKTLSILSLIVDSESLQAAKEFSRNSATQQRACKATLLVCPVSTVANWEEQLKHHIKSGKLRYYIYHGPNRTQHVDELAKYDLVLTTYSTVAAEFGRRKPLELAIWFRIVLDEAHCIRNKQNKQSQAICSLAADRRWAVTGTPVQNRLEDLGALLKFLRIKPFEQSQAFQQFFLAPFKAADADVVPKLQLLVSSITLRRLKNGLVELPARHDRIVRLKFSKDEQHMHTVFENDSRNKVNAVTSGNKIGGHAYARILTAILNLRLICAHGYELLGEDALRMLDGMSADNAITIGDEDEEEMPLLSQKQAYEMLHLLKESDTNNCRMCDRKIASDIAAEQDATEDDQKSSDTLGFMTQCYSIICPKCIKALEDHMQEAATDDAHFTCSFCDSNERNQLYELKKVEYDADQEERANMRKNPKLAKKMNRYRGPHTKTLALLDNLKQDKEWSAAHPEERPIKSVVFSTWTTHLDLIEIALQNHNHKFTRLDGSLSRTARATALRDFADNSDITVILVSIGAGGLGLNLTTASRAYVMEPQFNPAAEAQAVDRVHRLGQKREVIITRFVMEDSFEEKMLELQRKKKALADLTMAREKQTRAEAAKQRLEDLRSLFR